MTPKILFIDIETKPILAWVWGLFDQNIALNQIEEDWCIISVAAKWMDEKEVMQWDLRKGITVPNEKKMLKEIWKLLDEADIVIGQNSKSFDVKKLNEQFLKYGMSPPSPYRQEDTLTMSKKNFFPTSHKLEYRSKNLNKKYKKLEHSKYPGFSLWKACISGDQNAWEEMATYNKFDVLSTEEYYKILRPWSSTIDINVFHDELTNYCGCGPENLNKRGTATKEIKNKFGYTNTGVFRRYQCKLCGKWAQGKTNLLSKEKRAALKGN
jgi:hypothetical protein